MDAEIEKLQKAVEEKQKQELALFEDKPKQEVVVVENDNKLVDALVNNETAIDIAKRQYADLANQKQIAKKMGNVVNRKTNADIETADLLVKEQEVSNKVKKAEQRNKLLQLKNERTYLKREQKHRLQMQREKQLREKYGDLLLRTCRKKQKDENGKSVFANDENGKPIINVPSPFAFFWIRLWDSIISTLNQTADIFGALNKNVIKGGIFILIALMIFVPPFRSWIFGLINFG